MRERFVWCPVQEKVVPSHERIALPRQRSALPAPMVITDEIAPMQSMADGKVYTSKSRYYAETKARGYEIVGNEKQKPKTLGVDERQLERDLSDAYDQFDAQGPGAPLKDKYPEQWKHD